MTLPQDAKTATAKTARATISMPDDLWLDIRRAALERGTSASELCIEALKAHMEKMQGAQ
jgi:hypothetical protein